MGIKKLGTSILLLVLSFAAVSVARAEDCSAITKFGIFDVRRTSQQVDLVDDLIKWLSVNEYKTEQDSRNAATKAGFIIPNVDIPINVDATYGENHASTWSKATLDYLQSHKEFHSKFAQEFTTANPNIVSAWLTCVTRVTGLVCWAKQTDKKDEVLLSLELRPISLPLTAPTITKIVKSPNLQPLSQDWKKTLNINVTPILFSRTGATAKEAANFAIDTDNAQYRCAADVPALPIVPICKKVVTPSSVGCVVGRNDFTGEGPKIGDKHLMGVHCHAPDAITGVRYEGCTGGACPFLDRHAEYDLPPGSYPKGTDVNLRFATNSSDPVTVTFTLFYDKTSQECTDPVAAKR